MTIITASSCETVSSGSYSATSPPALCACCTNPSSIDLAPGKSALTLPVPCQLIVQPPDWSPISSAPAPAIRYLPAGSRGRRPPGSFISTNDRRTASRASSRCASAPIMLVNWAARFEGKPLSIKPDRNFTVRMRRTASSIRASEISPALTCATIFSRSVSQSLGTITMSIPALMA